MKVILDIPKEFESDLQDKFNEFFERVIAEITNLLDYEEPLCCGNYERETAEMFLKAFEKATIIPDNATNGDMIKAMFPNAKFDNAMPFTDGRWETMNLDTENRTRATYKPTQLRTYADWWNAPYKKEGEE